MKINFLIPTTGLTGGIKVIFEHANNLVNWGHQVSIIYPYVLDKNANRKEKIIGQIKKIRRIFLKIIGQDKIKWFNLDPRIKVLRVSDLSAQNIPNADITVATANETADWLVNYPPSKGQKFYFIQDYETWTRGKNKVDATWKMPLKKIVIATWLKKLGEKKFGEKIYGVVLNGVDFKKFYNDNKIFNKNKRVLMMYHILEKKGIQDGLKAFQIAKDKHPEIELTLFGAYKPRSNIPKEIKFYYKPSLAKLRELYSTSDIFLWPSRFEGFGIPPMEAMACKCAVISTDTGAIHDYAIPDETVIIVPPKRPELMAEKLIELIENEERLKKISLAGYEKIKEFSWEKSSRYLEKIFLDEITN